MQIEIGQLRFGVIDLLFRRLEPEHLYRHGPDPLRELRKRVVAARIRSGDEFLIALGSSNRGARNRLVGGFDHAALPAKETAGGAEQKKWRLF